VKLGGVIENTLSNIIYRIIVFQEVIIAEVEEVSRSIIWFYVMVG
jgi:lambda repressor-like predicted transcriptional regulator